MTYDELRDELRETYLSESTTDYYTNAMCIEYLYKSASEIATSLGFIRGVSSIAVSDNDTDFAAPADLSTVRNMGVSFAGWTLRRTNKLADILQLRDVYTDDPPRLFYYPEEAGNANIEVGPAFHKAGNVSVEYAKTTDLTVPGTPSSDKPWGGMLEEFHDVISLRAADRAFRAAEEFQKAEQYRQLYMLRLQEFALFLGHVDLPNSLIGVPQDDRRRSD